MKNKQPLEGIKVLELSRVLAGPWAAQLLCDLGAEVVKVESPKGDETRSWYSSEATDCISSYFRSANRGKKSIVADFSKNADLEVVQKLAARADVIIENFKVGSLKKFDLHYAKIKEINSNIIYCSITGFGQTGPYSNRLGYDFVIQAMGGIMDLTGEIDRDGQKPGVAYADIFTALYSVVAIQSALLNRKISSQNNGTYIDMSLFDTQLGVLANQAGSFLDTGISPTRMGNAHPVIVPYQKFDAEDGPIIIACGNDRQFKNLSLVLGLNLHNDSRYVDNKSRVQNRETLISGLQKTISKYTKKTLLSKLERVSVPSGAINNVGEALSDSQAVYREMVRKIGSFNSVRTPILFDTFALKYKHSAPKLGEHTTEIKRRLKNENFWKN